MITNSFEILGQNLKLKAKDVDQAEFQTIIEYYKKNVHKLKEAYPTKPDIEIAILAGITIADELHTLSKSKGESSPLHSQFLEEKVSKALKLLETSLD